MIKIALKDRKISSWSKPVTSLEDKPKMTANELKAVFDSNSNQIKPAINNIIDDLTGVNGASDIGVNSIDSIDGATVQAVLNSLATLSKSNRADIDNLSTANGAGKIGLNAIDSISGATVQAVLNSLATLSKSNRADIDNLSTANGAGKIGISPIKELQGSNLQEIVENIWEGVMQIETGDPNEFQYIKKTDKGQPDGVASLDTSGKVPSEQLPAMNYIPTSEKAKASGVATLDTSSKLVSSQIPTTVTSHISNKSNPHGVTASQLGVYTKSEVDQKTSATGVPVGTVIWFAGTGSPSGYLLCDGATVSSSTYSALYSAIGTTYGGNSSSFALPNLINQFIKGSTTAGTVNTGTTITSYGGSVLETRISNPISSSAGSYSSLKYSTQTYNTGYYTISSIQPPNLSLKPYIKY